MVPVAPDHFPCNTMIVGGKLFFVSEYAGVLKKALSGYAGAAALHTVQVTLTKFREYPE